MAPKREKPWEWDLEREQKLFAAFKKNFIRQDPVFAQWVDCYFTICHQKTLLMNAQMGKSSHKNLPDTIDPVLHTLGEMLAHEPEREADRLYYMAHTLFDGSALNPEGAGHDMCAILGAALEIKAKKNKQKPQ